MNRSVAAGVAISSFLALVAVASAGDNHHNRQSGNSWKPTNSSHSGWGGFSQVVSGFKNHHGQHQEPKNNPIPIDPGRGDGRVPVNPKPVVPPVVRDHRQETPPSSGGFVFVNGHWERAKAPTGPIIRDHRTPGANSSGGVTVTNTNPSNNTGPIIRDHRTAPVIRDHRTSGANASGGVIVTTTNPTTNSGPIIRDHRTGPIVRDHRTTGANASGGVTVTNTNSSTTSGPIIRDHRTGPIVRDHRTLEN
jgi:hypothetical protein